MAEEKRRRGTIARATSRARAPEGESKGEDRGKEQGREEQGRKIRP
jgi:hypothetical protein